MSTDRVQHSAARLALVAIVALCGACMSAKRYELDIPRPSVSTPAQGPAIVISEVTDSRRFISSAMAAKDASPHQLATGGEDDPAITSRTFAQLRSNRAKPVYDFLLPEGRSVTDLTREALESGFRRAGFRVLAYDDPAAAEAIRVNAEVLRFWSWNTGFWTFRFTFEAEVALQGDLTSFEQARTIDGKVVLHSAVAARPQSFVNTTTKGLENLSEKLGAALVTPAPSSP